MRRASLWVGGVLNALCAVFHGSFPVVFHWRETLATLSPTNRAVTYALAFHATLVIAAFAYVSFAHAKALLETNLGRVLCRVVTAFYLPSQLRDKRSPVLRGRSFGAVSGLHGAFTAIRPL